MTNRIFGGTIIIGRSVATKAINYSVLDLETGEYFLFVEGSLLTSVKVIAGKGTSTTYRNATSMLTDMATKPRIDNTQRVMDGCRPMMETAMLKFIGHNAKI